MPTQAYAREATVATASVFTKLTGTFDGGTADDIITPAKAKSIQRITVGVGLDGAAAADGTVIVRLRGSGMTKGIQDIAVCGTGSEGTPVTYDQVNVTLPVSMPVQSGDIIIEGCYSGADSGTPELSVGLVFSDKPGTASYQTREAQTGTADTWTTLSGDGTATGVNEIRASGSRIVQAFHAVGPSATTQEPCGFAMRLQGIGGSMAGGDAEHTYVGPSMAAADGTVTAVKLCPSLMHDMDIPVVKGGQVRIQAVASGGAVTGTPEQAVTLVFVD